MAVRSPQAIQIAGTAPTYHAASAGGDKINSPSDRTFIHVKNDSAGSVTATIVTPGTVVGQAVGDVAKAMAAGEEWFFGPLTSQHFGNSDGQVDVTWSSETSVTFAALRI